MVAKAQRPLSSSSSPTGRSPQTHLPHPHLFVTLPEPPTPRNRTDARPTASSLASSRGGGAAPALLLPSSPPSSPSGRRNSSRAVVVVALFWVATGGLVGTALTARLSTFVSDPTMTLTLTSNGAAAAAAAAAPCDAPKQLRQQLLLPATGGWSSAECARGETHTERGAEAAAADAAAVSRREDDSSPLERLYAATTGNGTTLADFVRYHALRTYPSLPDLPGLMMGNPSVAHDPVTNRTVLGFRLEHRALPKMLRMTRFLMLCEMAVGGEADRVEGGGRPQDGSSAAAPGGAAAWRCHDSGIGPGYVPPECDARHWRHPAMRVRYAYLTLGPEDARLFFDARGDLGAAFMMRGCHPGTKYGNGTALWSVYTMRWRHSHGAWRVFRYPKVLDLRTPSMGYLGDKYPIVTKSWVPIPGPDGTYAAPDNEHHGGLRFSVGWTRNMAEHVVYKVATSDDTLSAVIPANANSSSADYSRLDLASYRASTNVVPFRGALLGMGHRQKFSPTKVYHHYWYAFCPREPYPAVALSDAFSLPGSPGMAVSFALGLALEGPSAKWEAASNRQQRMRQRQPQQHMQQQNLYVTWSEHDRTPHLTRFSSEEVVEALRNSTFASDRGGSYVLDFDGDFTALCAGLSDGEGGSTLKGTA
jgi:hypothetical protein